MVSGFLVNLSVEQDLERRDQESGPERSRDEEAFEDRTKFLRGKGWRGGRAAEREGEGAATPS